MSKKNELDGILPALSTICDRYGEIDEEGQRSLVSFNIEKGVDGVVALVMNGEFYKYTDEERKKITDVVIDETNGRVPVLIGTTYPGTVPTTASSRYAQDAGADGVVVLPPFFNPKEANLSLYDHYTQVARSIDIPIMIQETEEITGSYFTPSLIEKLNASNDNIRYFKTEGALALSKISDVHKLTKGRVKSFGGYFGFSLIEELRHGASGTVPGCSIPEICLEAYRAQRKGHVEKAKAELERYSPYLDFNVINMISFPQIDKEVLKMRGEIKSAHVRGPNVSLTDDAVEKLKKVLKIIGILDS